MSRKAGPIHSNVEMASSWPSWESCCIFGRRERSIVESANSSLNVKTVKLDEAFDAASVRTFGKTGHFSADTAVLEAAWGIVLGSYTGAEDVCFGVSTLGGEGSMSPRPTTCANTP